MGTSNLLYFIAGLNKTYLLEDTMEQLKVIPQDFPVSGAATIKGEPTEDNDDTDNPATGREKHQQGPRPPVSCQGDSKPPLDCNHRWPKRTAQALGPWLRRRTPLTMTDPALPPVAALSEQGPPTHPN